MSAVSIELAITLFSGFLQKLGSPGSGLVGLEHEVADLCVGHRTVRTRLYPWDTNASDVAEALWRYRPHEGKFPRHQIHMVVGYSYGGDRAIKFIQELARRGDCTVAHLILCDGVCRWDRLPGVAAAIGIGYLEVPSIVQKCTYFRQKNPRWKFGREGGVFQPAGHPVVKSENSMTAMDGPHWKVSEHSYIDNDSEFRKTVLDSAERLLSHVT